MLIVIFIIGINILIAQSDKIAEISTNPSAIHCNTSFLYNNKNTVNIKIVCGLKSYSYCDSFIQPQNHIMQIEFEDRAINKPIYQKLLTLKNKFEKTNSKTDALDWVFPNIDKFVKNIVAKTNCEPIDSKIKFFPNRTDMFEITEEKSGCIVDPYDIKEQIFDALLQNKKSVCITPTTIQADTTKQENQRYTHRFASFATDYSRSTETRKHNIELALSSINGTVIEPGATFSFNQVVGDRTEKRGYQESKIIVNGQFVEGIGGGVCQVSTTLYNAAIRADMTIISVRNHSLPIAYVPPSFDAMVNSGSSDLKFQNTKDSPVFIKAYTKDNRVTIEFYGAKLPFTIVPESETVDTLPPPLEDEEIVDTEFKYIKPDTPSGQKIKVLNGKGGLISKGYLNYYDSKGQLIARKQIRRDKYQPQKGLIAIAP